MHRERFWIFRLGLLALLPAVLLTAGCREKPRPASGEPLHIGYMICNSLEETRDRFEPLTAYLSDVLGVEVVSHYMNTFEVEDAAREGVIQVAHTNSLLYVVLEENQNWKLVAGEKRGEHGVYTAGTIMVRRDSPIQTLEDLKGKRLMFGPELAPMGYLSQYYLFLEAGFDPEMDLDYYAIPRGSFKHEKVVYAVLYGGYDAGAIPVLDLEVMEEEGKIRREDYRLVATGELIPYCTLSISPGVSGELVEAFQKALLEITRDTTAPVGKENLLVLDRALVDGFQILDDSDYDHIREMARRTNMPPYQEF